MNIEHLRYFKTIVDLKSISKAALELHLTQSALSQVVQSLETDLQCELLERSNRGVLTTRFGAELYRYCATIVDSFESMVSHLRQMKSEALEVRIKHCCSLNNDLLPHLFYKLQNAYPNAKISVAIDERLKIFREIEQGIIDFGLVLGDVKEARNLTVTYLGAEKIVLVASSTYPIANKIDLNDLLCHKIIDFSNGSYQKLIRSTLAKAIESGLMERSYTPFFSIDSISGVKTLIEKNGGLAFLPISTAIQEIELDRLRIIEVRNLDLPLDIKMVSLKDSDLNMAMIQVKNTFAMFAEAYLLRYQIC
ncbi:MAG: LysR family transcriptional regulator [Bacillus subtilis]|nr:LysR family transcriptional regulator [Bacillus subtilis]